LEEVTTADIIIHVRDIAHPASDAQRDDVLSILSALGIGNMTDEQDEDQPEIANVPIIEIWNKIDLLDEERLEQLQNLAAREDNILLTSAEKNIGLAELRRFISDRIAQNHIFRRHCIALTNGAALAWLHNKGEVKVIAEDDQQITIEASLSAQNWGQYDKLFGGN
jgi:GTPase